VTVPGCRREGRPIALGPPVAASAFAIELAISDSAARTEWVSPAPVQPGNSSGEAIEMPHYFIKLSPTTPNPGPLTRDHVAEVCRRHNAMLEHYWHDDPVNPAVGYILVEEGDIDGLSAEVAAHEVLTLHRVR
jgi:hypothetical protein